MNVHPAPRAAIASPARRLPHARAYQIPSAATESPISSPVARAGTAHIANAPNLPVSRNHTQNKKRGIASVTG